MIRYRQQFLSIMAHLVLALPVLGLLPSIASGAEVDVVIEGIDDELLENVHGYLGIWQYRDESDLTELAVRRLHSRASAEIRNALMPYGYYSPDIDAQLSQDDDASWTARYRITPGVPVTVGSIDIRITGSDDLRDIVADIVSSPPLRIGERLHHGRYAQLKDSLLRRALANGYLDVRFTTQVLRVDRNARLADIELELESGTQFRFGPVEFRQDLLDEEFLQRYVEFEQGEPFNYDAMLDLRYGLVDSEYYADVKVRADREAGENNALPVIVEATRNRQDRYTFGLGFGTDTGARATASWQNRFVNRRGHQAGAEIRTAEVGQAVGLSYSIPLKKPRVDRFVWQAGWEKDSELGDQVAYTTTVSGNLIRLLGNWQRTAFVRYEQERDVAPTGETRSTLVMPGVSYLKTASDHPLFTSHGYSLFYELRGASESLGSDIGFVQLRFRTRRVYSPLEDWRFLMRLDLAGTAIDETLDLPASQRFFAGGDRSVRGYEYNRLGPTDADGNVVGGKYLATGSLELERMVSKSWAVAVFVDAGNAADEIDMEIKSGAGIGLRWRSPLGMVRFDLATPLDSVDREEGGINLHISIGPDL